ncbi:hypothetical protein B0H17DRAFT_523949 [Mycena rosella]|uniref:Uncharacterized protein n=1 Tax=Mycena rosella TaxID=1033263 RepID=A0AAD7GY56_MYCRO|nr:hypothetical protein B0H17DRAFT_523949 [Mycena rosella]
MTIAQRTFFLILYLVLFRIIWNEWATPLASPFTLSMDGIRTFCADGLLTLCVEGPLLYMVFTAASWTFLQDSDFTILGLFCALEVCMLSWLDAFPRPCSTLTHPICIVNGIIAYQARLYESTPMPAAPLHSWPQWFHPDSIIAPWLAYAVTVRARATIFHIALSSFFATALVIIVLSRWLLLGLRLPEENGAIFVMSMRCW